MNSKIIVGIIGILIVVAGLYFATRPAAPITYVSDVADAVAELEADLQTIDAQVKEGTLTEEEAVIARDRISIRLDSIYADVASSDAKTLSSELRTKLQGALTDLSDVLTKYADTLVAVDVIADPDVLPNVDEEDIPQAGFRNMGYEFYRGSASAKKKSLVAKAATTLNVLEDHVEEVGGESTVSPDVWDEFEEFVDEDVFAEEEGLPTQEGLESGTSNEGEGIVEENGPNIEMPVIGGDETVIEQEEHVVIDEESTTTSEEEVMEEGTTTEEETTASTGTGEILEQ